MSSSVFLKRHLFQVALAVAFCTSAAWANVPVSPEVIAESRRYGEAWMARGDPSADCLADIARYHGIGRSLPDARESYVMSAGAQIRRLAFVEALLTATEGKGYEAEARAIADLKETYAGIEANYPHCDFFGRAKVNLNR